MGWRNFEYQKNPGMWVAMCFAHSLFRFGAKEDVSGEDIDRGMQKSHGRPTMTTIALPEVTRAEVTILIDNYTDLLLGDTAKVQRLRLAPPAAPLAEHGLAYLVSVHADGRRYTLLMDAGISGSCLVHNAALLSSSRAARTGVVTHKLEDARCVVLSHGHFDHFGGLMHVSGAIGRKIPLLLHPGAFAVRRVKTGAESFATMPVLEEEILAANFAVVDKREAASTTAEGHILLTGTVARSTSFEKETPYLQSKQKEEWRPDRFEDDQAIAFRLKDRGLVVLGGCSHAGIINTVEHIRRVSGEEKVHAVLGGFHLSGADDRLIEQTVAAMQQIGPSLLVPTHCTGWKAINAFAAAMPDQFVLNTVGTTYLFTG
ncbi:MAG: MBL fold metallo-hydrolase [Desulfobacteraceae bacterium]|nr:MAG: MBL fold metallo-hydrolase [Desulfobacteraceae bacterium]